MTVQTENLKKELKSFIDNNCSRIEKNDKSLCHSFELESIINKIKNTKSEFDSQLFIIIVVGPVKSGKSTLVNLLANDHVSPTDFVECTMRPSIIKQSKNKSIDQYFPLYAKNNIDEVFNDVISHIKGVKPANEIEGLVASKNSVELSKENLDKKVKKEYKLEKEPLITVINVDGGRLINNKIALLDMPGLDGAKSNIDELGDNPALYKWVLQKADFILFVQSSNSAINKATTDSYIKQVYQNSRRPPIWFVQNVFDSAYWRSKEKRSRQIKEQLHEGLNLLHEYLGVDAIDNSSTINLGKVHDYVYSPDDYVDNNELKQEHDRFRDFENKLLKTLQDNRVLIQEKNNVKQSVIDVNNCLDKIEKLNASLQQETLNIEEFKKSLEGKKQLLINIKFPVEDFKNQCIPIFEECKEKWKNNIESLKNSKSGLIGTKIKRSKLRDLIKDYSINSGISSEAWFSKAGVYHSSISFKAADVLLVNEKNIIDDINKFLLEIGLNSKISSDIHWTEKDTPSIDKSDFPIGVLPKWGLLGLPNSEAESYLYGHYNIFINEIEKRVNNLLNIDLVSSAEAFTNKRKENQISQLDQILKNYSESKDTDLKKIRNTAKLIQKQKTELESILVKNEEAINSLT